MSAASPPSSSQLNLPVLHHHGLSVMLRFLASQPAPTMLLAILKRMSTLISFSLSTYIPPYCKQRTCRISHPHLGTLNPPCQQYSHAQRRRLGSSPSLYLRITSLTVSGTNFTVHLYAPTLNDVLRGILYHAFDNRTGEVILADLQASNLILVIVASHRMDKTPHILVALTETKVLWRSFYHDVQLRLLPFRNKVEACFKFRSTGHLTDVFPMLRKDRYHRCHATHPPLPENSPPTCTLRCIVRNGDQSTHSSKCKHRYGQRPQRWKTLPPTYCSSPQQPEEPPLSPLTQHSVFPLPHHALPSSQLAALQQENASLCDSNSPPKVLC
ncbi:hypothetical protein HPB51_016720 [Rhipicephalus microplus]|uniref:Uncharacterized protein n=1 Tax=Rhipicephalus microplus TaxID=6941 RepID=A0A9J6DAY2_RHIMP|nr:hypothetical protein HPB51_016720 [Rhipicephalus microplus]